VGTAPDNDDAEMKALALERFSTRFADPEVEKAFRAWYWARSRGLLFLALLGSIALWLVTHAVLLAADFERVVSLSWVFVIVYASQAFAFVANVRNRVERFAATVLAVDYATGLAAIVLVAVIGWELDNGAFQPLVAVFACLFMFAVGNDGRWVINAPPAAAFVVYGQVDRVLLWSSGGLSTGGLAVDSALLWMSLAVGVVVGIGLSASSHLAYRQERIIEAQKRTIERERARSEELLRGEVAHQVAERSRELGAVLAKTDAALDVRRLVEGERFAERYKVVSALGAGGMGAVYEVERVTDGARLALKAVVGEVSSSAAARFAREAEIGARVRHANVTSIVDVGVAQGVPFLVMELMKGGSLEAQRERFGDAAFALPMLKQIATGLAALHDAGVVHRDLKPANVLLSADGTAKISDFGISRFGALSNEAPIDPEAQTMGATPRGSELTGTGVVMGTPLYMAPEAARGGKQLDTAADVFALGIIAYELFCGRAPFSVPPFVLALAAAEPILPSMDDAVPSALRPLISSCLATDPSERPSVHALISALS
jgi:hypothetical protein